MKRIRVLLIVFASLLVASAGYSQSYLDIRINELQKENVTGISDENGERCGWIELFNSAYGMIDVAGFYITDTPQDNVVKAPKGKVFQIPKGNPKTIIPLRGYFLLFADGDASKGAFHMNYTLDGINHLYLYEPGGQLIDQVEIEEIPADKSYGRKIDGTGKHEPLSVTQRSLRKSAIDAQFENESGWGVLSYATPGITNTTDEVKTKSQKMKEIDPHGVILFLTCFSVVFLALLLLFFCFKWVGNRAMKKNPALSQVDAQTHKEDAKAAGAAVSDEAYAAIAVACYMFEQENEVHDFEPDVITINSDLLSKSPWGLRENNL